MNGSDGNPKSYLLPQPGQKEKSTRKFHPLPGQSSKEQIKKWQEGSVKGTTRSRAPSQSPLQKALSEEKRRIDESMRQQGIIPGQAIYENPTQNQNVLLPTIKYASG